MSFVLLAAMVAAEPAPASRVRIGNDLLATADGKTIFARGKDGLEAIDATTGKLLWMDKGAGVPAGASGDLVFGWLGDEKKPNSFRVAALNAKSGETAFTSEPITLPEWATTAKQGGRSFRTAAYLVAGGVRRVQEQGRRPGISGRGTESWIQAGRVYIDEGQAHRVERWKRSVEA